MIATLDISTLIKFHFNKLDKSTGKKVTMTDHVRKMLLKKISLYGVQSQFKESSIERRKRIEDRRRLFTFIAKDRRSGIADRRKNLKNS
jgi:hypothetical protein